jgi:protein-disulfide isomerase
MGKRAQIQAREVRRAKAAAARRIKQRNRVLAAAGGLIVVGLVIAIVVSLVNAAGKDRSTDPGKALVQPASATANGALVVGNADAPVRLEVYLDYMCPYCGRFERANSDELERLVADGTVRLEMYPLAFLDKASSGTRYSTRAANAVATVADRAPDKILAFNRALFAHQPDEGGEGLTDDEIQALARGVSVSQDVINLFANGTFEPWLAKYTEAAFHGGITGTPTVKINGKRFEGDMYTAGPLTRAITDAKAKP